MNQKTAAVTTTAPPPMHIASIVGDGSGSLTVAQIKANRHAMLELMQSEMKPGVDYGKIKGVDKPSLFKPGAEKLLMLFRVEAVPDVEDLSGPDLIRYRVKLQGIHMPTGISVGRGMGEASTDEDKYRWRATYNRLEWENTPEDRRRTKYGSKKTERGWEDYETRQIRTNPADAANTILKMAEKRAKVALALAVTGASDIFSQDLEEMEKWLREAIDPEAPDAGDAPPATSKAASTSRPQAKAAAQQTVLNDQQVAHLRREIDKVGCGEKPVLLQFNIDTLEALPFAQLNTALKYVAGMHQEPPT